MSVFNPAYGQELKRKRVPRVRKSKTLRELTAAHVRSMLESQPTHEMPLKEVINRLTVEFQRHRHTFYQYLSRFEFIETVAILESSSQGKICRLKSIEGLADRITQIRSEDARRKVHRALAYLNEDNIDLGLFLLSKEFEATVKVFLESAYAAGRLSWTPTSHPSKWKLADLITIAEKNNLITDAAALNYLRQERNQRAHGSMPSKEERQALMKGAGTLAGPYIDYITFFANRSEVP